MANDFDFDSEEESPKPKRRNADRIDHEPEKKLPEWAYVAIGVGGLIVGLTLMFCLFSSAPIAKKFRYQFTPEEPKPTEIGPKGFSAPLPGESQTDWSKRVINESKGNNHPNDQFGRWMMESALEAEKKEQERKAKTKR